MSLAETEQPAPDGLTIAGRFAQFARALDGARLPEPVRAKAALCLLDFLAACRRAGDLDWSRQAAALVRAEASRPEAAVFGTETRAAAGAAAFANATTGHGLIREDMHVASACHIGVVVIPAALAVAEREGASGAELLAAIVAGYEITARLGRAVLSEDFATRFRPTGIIGPFGAALAAARLSRLTEEETVQALGLAGNTGAGLNAWPWSGGTEIYFHAGNAARAGVVAADLARLGAQASPDIVEGEGGLLAAHGTRDREAAVIAGLGADGPEILAVRHKPAPGCNYAQTPAGVAQRVVRRPADEIEEVVLHTFDTARAYPGCDWSGPFESLQQAKMSIQYAVAAVLSRGALDEAHFRAFSNGEITGLARRVRLVSDPKLQAAYPARQPARIEVRYRDGEVVEAALDDVDWLDSAAVVARFRNDLGPTRAARIEGLVAGLEGLDDISALVAELGA